jgi:methionyl-tRNA formyltransferase
MTRPELRLVMVGTGTFAEPTFLALLAAGYHVVGLVTQPGRPGGAQRGSTRQTGIGMKPIALERGIAVVQPESINTPEAVAALHALRPDLLVVAAYGQILSKEVLATASHGGINIHASLLPKYRGAAPVAWAIYHGEKQTGVTIIRMSVTLDAGDMLAQEAVDIGPDETAGELEARLAGLGARLAVRVIEEIAAGPVPGVKQDKSQVTRAPKLTKEHGLIDWQRHGRDVCNHLRAMQPWPTPYTFLHQAGRPAVRLLILKARWQAGPAGAPALSPGEVAIRAEDAGRLTVGAGGGTQVEVLELQPAGKRRMTAAAFLRGHPPAAGAFLGPEAP